MFQYWRDLARKHKRKVIISTGVVAASYFIGKYVASKIEEFQKRIKEENFAKEQVKRRFKQTQNDSYMTFLSLLPVLVEPIYEDLNVEEITGELRSRRSSRKISQSEDNTKSETGLSTVASEEFKVSTKTTQEEGESLQKKMIQNKSKSELWSALKTVSLTRFMTLFYCQSMLIIYLHLQLNILSRKSYYESAVKLASVRDADLIKSAGNSSNQGDENTLPEQAFLSFSWWFLNKGWLQLKNIIEDSVEDVFGEINPRQKLSIKEFASLINTCQQTIYKKLQSGEDLQNDSSDAIVNFLLPPHDKEFYLLQQTNSADFLADFNADITNTENLEKFLAELRGYLQNEQVTSLLNILVTVGISLVLDNILADIEANTALKSNIDASEPNATKKGSENLKLASLLALITKQSNKLTNNSLDNDILCTLNNLQELEDLSANVYSNFIS